MVIAKPAPFLNFTPSLEWLENMRGVTPEAEEFVAKKTDFLMEIFKFMPKAAAFKFDKGAMSEMGALGINDFSQLKVDDGTGLRAPTITEIKSLLTALKNSRVIYNDSTGAITHSFAEMINIGSASVESFSVTPLFHDNKKRILSTIKKKYYAGRNQYSEFRQYNEQYAYDINNQEGWSLQSGAYTKDKEINNFNTNFSDHPNPLQTYVSSSAPYGWGTTHRQTEVGGSKGSQLYLSDVYKWFNGAGDFKWSPDQVSGINSVVPIYDRYSPTFTGLGYKDFSPNDYTNMVYGLNPLTMKNRYTITAFDRYDLPELTCYSQYFAAARSSFADTDKNYYDIIKTGEYNSFSDEKLFHMFLLMLESKRRFIYTMTEIFGPHTQGAGFTGHVDRVRYSTGIDSSGNLTFSANTSNHIFTVDNYMMGFFSRFINDPRVSKVSGYKTGFLSIFYENIHEFSSFLTAVASKKVVNNGAVNPVDGSKWLGYYDHVAIKAFHDCLDARWDNIRNMILDYMPSVEANFFESKKGAIDSSLEDVADATTPENLTSGIVHILNRFIELQNMINPSLWKVPTYNLYRLYDDVNSTITALASAKDMQVRLDEDGNPIEADMSAKKKAAASAANAMKDYILNNPNAPDMKELIDRIKQGDSIDELRNELRQIDTGTAKHSYLPVARTDNSNYNWDNTGGNWVSNRDPDTGLLRTDQGHFYSPTQQTNNFPAGGANRTSVLELNYAVQGSYSSLHRDYFFSARPYDHVWGTRAFVDLQEAYLFEEIMRFAVKNLWNKPRKKQYSARMSEYRQQKDYEQQAEKEADAAAKRRKNEERKYVIKVMRRKKAEQKKQFRKMMKESAEKMKALRKIQKKNASSPASKPANK